MTRPTPTLYQRLQASARRIHWEETFLFQIRAEGLPAPAVQLPFHSSRKWRLDFAWIDYKIAVEVDGGTKSRGRHVRHEGFEGDCFKRNEATARGWRIFNFTSDMVKSGHALGFMKGVLRAEGAR
jgi:very-short-patch-repair endonuclease